MSPAQGGGRGTCSNKGTTAVNRGGDVGVGWGTGDLHCEIVFM